MTRTLSWLIVTLSVLLLSAIWARADWKKVVQEWAPYMDKMTPEQQERTKGWFKDQRSSHGVPCCDQADGHPTDYDIRDSGYWIPDPIHLELPRQWIQIPPEAVIRNTGNPVGEAVVWWTQQGSDTVYIRCFVPGGGV